MPSNAYTFFCLGTDTEYTPDSNYATKNGAPHGLQETLSTVIQYVSGNPIVDVDDDSSAAYARHQDRSPDIFLTEVNNSTSTSTSNFQPGILTTINSNAAIISGPETFGGYKYEIISKSLAHLLNQMANRPDLNIINLAGHSRGAVETIILSHELQRIKEETFRQKTLDINSLADIIKNSNHADTKTILRKLTIELNENQKEILINNISNLKVNIFAIDPVPGGTVHGVNVAEWIDDRYFQIPPIVSNYQQVIMENERTRGFKTFVPIQQHNDNQCELIPLPGHHGTATGNPYQQQIEIDIKNNHLTNVATAKVQEITIYHLHDFMLSNGTLFSLMGHKNGIVDNFFNAYIQKNLIEKESYQLQTYNNILENKTYFSRFNRTSYPTLGLEQSIKETFGYRVNYNRMMTGPNKTTLYLSEFLSNNNIMSLNDIHTKLITNSLTKSLSITTSCTEDEPGTQLRLFISTVLESKNDDILGQTLLHNEHDFIKKLTQNLNALSMELATTYLEQDELTIDNNILNFILSNNKDENPDEVVNDKFNIIYDEDIEATVVSSSDETNRLNQIKSALKSNINRNFFLGIENIIDKEITDSLSINIQAQNIIKKSDDNDEKENIQDLIREAHKKYEKLIILIQKLNVFVSLQQNNEDLLNKISILNLHNYTSVFLCATAMRKEKLTHLPDDIKDTFFGEKIKPILSNVPLNERSNIKNQSSTISNNLLLKSMHLSNQVDNLKTELQKSINNYSNLSNELVEIKKHLTITNEISYPILSGFILALGITAVALALTVLTHGIPVVLLASAGVTLCVMGLFGTHHAAQEYTRQETKNNILNLMPE